MKDTLTRPGVAEAACLWSADLILPASFYVRERSTSWVSLRRFNIVCHKSADVRPHLFLHGILVKHSEKMPRYHNQHPRPNSLLLAKGNSVILKVRKTYSTVLTARSFPKQIIRKLMPTAKGSGAISEPALSSEVKPKGASPCLPVSFPGLRVVM